MIFWLPIHQMRITKPLYRSLRNGQTQIVSRLMKEKAVSFIIRSAALDKSRARWNRYCIKFFQSWRYSCYSRAHWYSLSSEIFRMYRILFQVYWQPFCDWETLCDLVISNRFKWTREIRSAFENLKSGLTSGILRTFDPSLDVKIVFGAFPIALVQLCNTYYIKLF